jgi:hypothetical protein
MTDRTHAAPASRERTHAILQTFGVIAITGVLTAVGVALARQPAKADELRIPIGELRSQAAELAATARGFSDGALTGQFVAAHALQLAKSTNKSFAELARLEVEPALDLPKAQALEDGRQVVTLVTDLRAGADVVQPDAERLRNDLTRLETGLEH